MALLLSVLFVTRIRTEMADFEVYWRAGGRVVTGDSLYRPEDGHYQLKYLPAFALAMVPLAWLPLPVAKAVWFALSVAAIGALIAISVSLWRGTGFPRRWLVPLVTIVMAKFYGHELTLGQSNALMATLAMLALVALLAHRDRRAGLLFAGAVLTKPYAVAFLPYLAVRGRWRACGWMAVGIVALLVAPAVVYGLADNARLLAAWTSTLQESTAPNLVSQDNVSVWAMAAKAIGPGATAFWLAAATAAAVALTMLWLIAARADIERSEFLECAALLLVLPLCSPQGWDYVLLVGTPAVVILIGASTMLPAPWRIATAAALAVMGLSLFDLLGRRAYAAFMSVSSITICALVLLAALVEVRRRRIA